MSPGDLQQRLKPEGEVQLIINKKTLRFQVTSAGSPILGKDVCIALKLIARMNALQSTGEDDETQGLGTIKSDAKIYTDPNVTPSIDPPRRIPHAIEKDVQAELEHMIKLGVIVHQYEADWVSSITIVKKPNKILVCLDPTKLNRAILRGPYPIKTVEEVIAKTSGAKYFSVLDA